MRSRENKIIDSKLADLYLKIETAINQIQLVIEDTEKFINDSRSNKPPKTL